MNNSVNQNSSLAVTVNAIDGDRLVLQTETGESIHWPREKAPSQINLLSPLTISLNTETATKAKAAAPDTEKTQFLHTNYWKH